MKGSDPGLGKNELTKWLGEQPGLRFVPAGKFGRHSDPASLIDIFVINVSRADEAK